MGLDIFLYKLEEPKLDTSKTYTEEELYEKGYSFIEVDDNERDEVYSQDIIDNFAVIVDVETQYDDDVAFFYEFQKKYPEKYSNIEDYYSDIESRTRKVGENEPYFDPRIVMQSISSQGMELKIVDYGPTYNDCDVDYSDLPYITISTKKEKDLEQFTYTKVRPTYVIKKTEVDYQRKGLNDRGWELLPDNCTYCTDESIVELLVDEGNLSESFLENWVDGETALYAWW